MDAVRHSTMLKRAEQLGCSIVASEVAGERAVVLCFNERKNEWVCWVFSDGGFSHGVYGTRAWAKRTFDLRTQSH